MFPIFVSIDTALGSRLCLVDAVSRFPWFVRFMGLLALLLLTPQLHAEDYLYAASNGKITIVRYGGPGGAIIIPDTIHGLPVVSIGDSAFYSRNNLTSVTIPGTVTSIGQSAFSGCTGLTTMNIPDNVTNIGDSAFSGCTGLKSVHIPGSVACLGESTFGDCSGLTELTIPNGVTNIGEWTFSGCTGLTRLDISGSVTSIGKEAFSNCAGLTRVDIPGGVTSIGTSAFADCTGLTSVHISNDVASIGNYAFSGCTALTDITVDSGNATFSSLEGVLFNKAQTVLIFYPPHRSGAYGIPASVTSIGQFAFEQCDGLTSVNIPASVTNIGDGAFGQCSGLTCVDLPNSVSHIGFAAFYDCQSLTRVNLAEGVAMIGGSAFAECRGLTSCRIPDSVTSIGSSAFHGCVGLTAISIPNGVTSIEGSTFFGCKGLTSCRIPDSVTSIGYMAFYNCIGLTDMSISANVTNIEDYAFFNCAGLTAVTVEPSNTAYSSLDGVLFDQSKTILMVCPMKKAGDYSIPASVKSIRESAFFGCADLTSVDIPDSVTSIADSTFSNCSGLTHATLPNSVTSIGNYAFSGCAGLALVAIPGSVTSIGNYAFHGCTGLTAIMVDSDNPGYSSDDGVLFDLAKTTMIQCPGGKAGSYTIPASATNLGWGGFSGCAGLTAINVAAGNPNYSSMDGVLFNHDQTLLIQCPRGKRGDYTIPASVTALEIFALSRTGLTNIAADAGNANFSSLDGVLFDKLQATLLQYPGGKAGGYTVPNTVTAIGYSAFAYCADLTNVTLPATVTTIGTSSFSYCSNLTSITLPASVTDIENMAFAGCARLTSASFLGNAPYLVGGVFGETAAAFTVYYFNDRTGFSSPTWNGYPAVNMGDSSPATVWLLANGMPYDTDLQADPDGDGVNLLMAYGLNLNPRQNLRSSMPRPQVTGDQLGIRFYAGGEGVIYTVESSADLQFWSSTGVTLSAPDANRYRVATVPRNMPNRFLRLSVALAP